MVTLVPARLVLPGSSALRPTRPSRAVYGPDASTAPNHRHPDQGFPGAKPGSGRPRPVGSRTCLPTLPALPTSPRRVPPRSRDRPVAASRDRVSPPPTLAADQRDGEHHSAPTGALYTFRPGPLTACPAGDSAARHRLRPPRTAALQTPTGLAGFQRTYGGCGRLSCCPRREPRRANLPILVTAKFIAAHPGFPGADLIAATPLVDFQPPYSRRHYPSPYPQRPGTLGPDGLAAAAGRHGQKHPSAAASTFPSDRLRRVAPTA